jgi:hypothetical protein
LIGHMPSSARVVRESDWIAKSDASSAHKNFLSFIAVLKNRI